METETNKNTYIAITTIVVILALVTLFIMKKNNAEPGELDELDTDSTQTTAAPDSGVETFSGTISAVDTGCLADAVCSVTIDGKKIILVEGGLGLPTDAVVGRLIGVDSIGDLEERMGAYANVYAGLTPGGDYTLYGNSEYYVQVVMISEK